jgi:dTDP-4-dehydrorhamnose 3,5-epimerase
VTVTETTIPGVLLVAPAVHGDARGFFVERYHAVRYAAAGIGETGFVQDNHSRSQRGVLRGLHFQVQNPQGKLVEVLDGTLTDVVLDVRPGSPTFGRWEAFVLDAADHRQLWVPPGLAHGFCVTSERVDFLYKCTALYDPADEGGVVWDDPDLGIAWPTDAPTLSDKDRALPRLRDLTRLPNAPFEASPAP